MSMVNHDGRTPTEKTPDLSTRALWQSYQPSSGSKQEEWAKGMMNLACSHFQVFYMP
jgi:hypothetical protein